MKHNCKATGKNGEYIYLCSRCDACYVCRHKTVLFENGEWMTKCKDGKFRPVIFDGRLRDPNFVPDPAGLMVIKSIDESLIDKALKDYQENGDPLEQQAVKGYNGKEWMIVFPHNELTQIRYSPGLS